MNAEFLKLVDQVKTVAIPEIGAVVKMGKKYTFNHFLKFNDGRFSKHLQSNGIPKEDADQKVDTWVNSIKESLDNNGSFVFEGMGVLYKEAGDKFRWEQLENSVPPIVEQKEPTVIPDSENVVNEIEEEPSLTVVLPQYESGYLSTDFDVNKAKDEISKIDNIEELIAFTKNDKRTTIISAVEKQTSKINEIASPEILTNDLPKQDEISESTEDSSIDVEVEKQLENESKILETIKEKENADNEKDEPARFNLNEDVLIEETETNPKENKSISDSSNKDKIAQDQQNQKPPKKKKKILFLVAMLLIISGTVIVGVIKYDQFKQYFFSEANQSKDELTKELNQNKPLIQADVVENTVNKNDSSINTNDHLVDIESANLDQVDNVVEIENEVPANVDNTPNELEEASKSASKGAYHLIVGSFNVETNANTFLESKIKEGFTNSSVFNGPKNKYYVEIGSYSSKNEAIKALSEFKIDAWVLKF